MPFSGVGINGRRKGLEGPFLFVDILRFLCLMDSICSVSVILPYIMRRHLPELNPKLKAVMIAVPKKGKPAALAMIRLLESHI